MGLGRLQLGYLTLSRALIQALASPLGGFAGACHPARHTSCVTLVWRDASLCAAQLSGHQLLRPEGRDVVLADPARPRKWRLTRTR